MSWGWQAIGIIWMGAAALLLWLLALDEWQRRRDLRWDRANWAAVEDIDDDAAAHQLVEMAAQWPVSHWWKCVRCGDIGVAPSAERSEADVRTHAGLCEFYAAARERAL